MWARFGAHGDLQAVFDADPPQEVLDEMDDIDDVLTGDWYGEGMDYMTALRARRGSRSVSEASGIFGGISRSRSRMNGFRRRRETRDGLPEADLQRLPPDPEGTDGNVQGAGEV